MRYLKHLLTSLLLIGLLAACNASDSSEASPAEPTATAEPAAVESNEDPGELPTGQRTYIIVAEESTASYHVAEEFFGLALGKYGIPEGLVETVGTTQAIEGQFELNWDDLAAPLGENSFTVDLSTLESDQSLRDKWIRENGPEFATYPNATFVGERLEGAPTTYTPGEEVSFQMVGEMTIHETTNPATLQITARLSNGTVTGMATADLTMTDYGITPPDFANTLTVGDAFQVKVEFTAREQ